jgi:uracil-DNA glycosylase family 4
VTDVTQMTIEQLEAAIRACTLCGLHKGRTQAVPGEGPVNADIMFIGEGPGFHEDRQGRPFVGAAGKFLEELLASIGLNRSQVYITNLVKCRPPGNRDPRDDELEACTSAFLDRQIEAIDPKVIVTLGRFSMARYFPNARISSVHGRAQPVNGRLVVPMYHPAAALHQPALRSAIEADFHRLPDWIQQAADQVPADEPAADDPQQLSLF